MESLLALAATLGGFLAVLMIGLRGDRPPAGAVRPSVPPDRRSLPPTAAQPQPKPAAKPAPAGQKAPPAKQTAEQPRSAPSQPPPAAVKREVVRPPAPDLSGGLPDEDELDRLISTVGVATVVQQLVRGQGWSVEQAATWIRQKRAAR